MPSMVSQFLVHIFGMMKKWVSRLARHSVSTLFSLLSLFRRFQAQAASHLRLRDRGPAIGPYPPLGSLIQSQGNATGDSVLIHPSHLPLDQTSLESHPSPSDVPYFGQGSAIRSLETATTTKACSSIAKSNLFFANSASSLHPSEHMGESYSIPSRNQYGSSENASASPSPSILETSSMISDTSARTSRSVVPSLFVPEDRRSEYRRLMESGHTLGSARNSTANLSHASSYEAPILPYSPVQAVPTRSTAPPASGGQPGSEVGTHYEPLIHELLPKQIKRYDRKARPPGTSNTIIPANTSTFLIPDTSSGLPDGWISVVHPEGSRYFVNEGKRAFTESNISDPKLYAEIEYGIEVLLDSLKTEKLDTDHVDLVIEPQVNESGNIVFCYYFARHKTRCIFWLNDFDAEVVFSDCCRTECVQSLSHKGLAIQAQYWRHWDYFPSLCPVSQDLVDEVNDMLMHAKCDHLSSKQSSAPYNVVEITDYMSIVDRIKVTSEEEEEKPQSMRRCHAAIVIGRIMYEFSRNAFINFHGEDCARLSFNQTIHDWKYKPSWWMVIFAPVLFLEPVIYVQELHKIFADKIARKSRWNEFSSRLKGQLQNSNLLATVLLNANVALLGAIKGESSIQMTNYMSLVASFGSIVLGLFFVSQDRISGQSTASETASFLTKLHDEKHGLESLAVIYSFPKALLIWGMMCFFVAFSMNWYTSGATSQEFTAAGVVTLLVFVMITVSVVRTKEKHHWLPMTRELLSDLVESMVPLIIYDAAGDPTHNTTHLTTAPRSPTPTTLVHLPQQPNDSNSVLHSYTSPSLLLGECNPQVQPSGETHGDAESGRSSLGVPEILHSSGTQRKSVTLSERNRQSTAAAMDSVVTTMSHPLSAERENVGCISEEPEEIQGSDSTDSLPRFRGRGPTGDDFQYALQVDGDIMETQDE